MQDRFFVRLVSFRVRVKIWNHTFYFACLKPEKNYTLKGPFADVIKGSFGSVSFFKDTFVKSAVSLFGSGWIWLVLNPKGSLEIIQESNAGNPLRRGLIPLLTCDVWEHAYYLDYHNRRTDYIEAFWKLINWELIEKKIYFCKSTAGLKNRSYINVQINENRGISHYSHFFPEYNQ